MTESEGVLIAKALSRLLGWAYFLCWSASFYPQPIWNWRRKSTLGLAIDFPTLNLLGFCCYTVSTAAFLYSPTIRSQYAHRNPDSPDTTVRFNDFLFAAHGACMCVIIYSQFYPLIWGLKVGSRQKASKIVLAIFWACVVAILLVTLLAHFRGTSRGYDPVNWAWIDVVYTLGYVKLLTVVLKYVPQAWVNYKRKSTEGWTIYMIMLDVSGALFSLGQLVIDSALQKHWTFTANPVKFGLGNITIVFDVVFIIQHYVLYKNPVKRAEEEEEDEDWDGTREQLLAEHSA